MMTPYLQGVFLNLGKGTSEPVVKIMDRLLLFLFSLFVGICSIITLYIGITWDGYADAIESVFGPYNDVLVRNSVLVVSILLLLVSIRFFYISVRRNQDVAPSIDQRTDFGDIRISMETVENLSLKAAARIRGVKDLKARVRVSDAGLEITIRTVVDGESSIPLLTEEIQRSVKSHIEEITGIPVSAVTVFVANIVQTNAFKSRVE